MKSFDRFLQRWRIAKVKPYIKNGSRILDIGSADGALFEQLGGQITEGIGIDPILEHSVDGGHYHLIAGRFPEDLPNPQPFDAITMLAVVEHIPLDQQRQLAQDCSRFLRQGGCLIITVPSPNVDHILSLLKFFRIIDGMSLEEHYGYEAANTASIFSVEGLEFIKLEKFQLGLNNLFVFKKTS